MLTCSVLGMALCLVTLRMFWRWPGAGAGAAVPKGSARDLLRCPVLFQVPVALRWGKAHPSHPSKGQLPRARCPGPATSATLSRGRAQGVRDPARATGGAGL